MRIPHYPPSGSNRQPKLQSRCRRFGAGLPGLFLEVAGLRRGVTFGVGLLRWSYFDVRGWYSGCAGPLGGAAPQRIRRAVAQGLHRLRPLWSAGGGAGCGEASRRGGSAAECGRGPRSHAQAGACSAPAQGTGRRLGRARSGTLGRASPLGRASWSAPELLLGLSYFARVTARWKGFAGAGFAGPDGAGRFPGAGENSYFPRLPII